MTDEETIIPESAAATLWRGLKKAPEPKRAEALEVLTRYGEQQKRLGKPLWPEDESRRIEEGARVLRLYTDPKHGLSDEANAEIDRAAFGSTKPEETKAAGFNRQYLAHAFGVDSSELNGAKHGGYRRLFAAQRWKLPDVSETEFFNRIKSEAELDMTGTKHAVTSALQQLPAEQAFIQWTEASKGNAAFDPNRWRDYHDNYRKRYAEVQADVARLNPVANKLFVALSTATTEADLRPLLPLVADLNDRDIGIVMALLDIRAQGERPQDKGTRLKSGEAIYRSIRDAWKGAADGFDLVDLSHARSRIERGTALVSPEATWSGTGAALVNQLLGGNQPAQGMPLRKLTEEEKAAALAEIDQRVKDGRQLRRLQTIADTVVDPIKSDNWIAEKFYYSALPSAGIMVNALIPGGVGLLANAAGYMTQEHDRLLDAGVPSDKALDSARLVGSLQAAGDALQAEMLVGRIPLLKRIFKNPARTTAGQVGAFATGAGINVIAETGIELFQDHVAPALIQEITKVGGDVAWLGKDGVVQKAIEAAPETAGAMVLLGLIGSGAATYRDVKVARQLLQSTPLLQGYGLNDAQASEVRVLSLKGELGAAGVLFRKYAAPALKGGATLDKASAAAGAAMAATEARRHKVALGELDSYLVKAPEIQRTEAGWKLHFPDGTESGEFASHDDATEAKWQHTAETQLFRPAEITRSIWSEAEKSGLRPGDIQAREFEFVPHTVERAVEKGLMSKEGAELREQQAQALVTGETVDVEYGRASALVDASSEHESDSLAGRYVLGLNKVEFAEKVRRITTRFFAAPNERAGGIDNPLTAVEEDAETVAKDLLANGQRDWLLSALREYEGVTGDKVLRTKIDADLTPSDLIEGFSHIATAVFVGRTMKGSAGKFAGMQSNRMREQIRGLFNLRIGSALDGIAEIYQAAFRRAAAIEKARTQLSQSKNVADLERMILQSVGLSEQHAHEQGVLKAAQNIASEAGKAVGIKPETTASTAKLADLDARYHDILSKGDSGSDPLPEKSTPEQDKAWLARNPKAAAELQRMVDARAKEAGYDTHGWHGSGEAWKIADFMPSPRDPSYKAASFAFAENRRLADRYAKAANKANPVTRKFYLKNPSPFIAEFDASGGSMLPKFLREIGSDKTEGDFPKSKKGYISFWERVTYDREIVNEMKRLGFTGAKWKEMGGRENVEVVFDPAQIKSADPITRDDSGRIIPLSERFNPERPEITFSMVVGNLTAERREELKRDPEVFWHGSASGDLRGGATGLHLGTFLAAKQALNATIGTPLEGEWDGTREYGKTMLAGRDEIRRRGEYATGYSADASKENHLPTGKATFSNGEQIPLDSKPNIQPFRIVGKMSNSPTSPHGDWQANGRMRGNLKRGVARSGFFYGNISEDAGSISAVVPRESHVEQITASTAKLAPGDIEQRVANIFNPFQRNPELRRALGLEMQRRAIRVARQWEAAANAPAPKLDERDLEVAAGAGDKIAAKRLDDLHALQAQHELELGGAQHDGASRAEIKAIREKHKAQLKKQREGWSESDANAAGKGTMLAALRTLDAIASALPPEVRAKVGGFTKVAELSTDEARLKEIERRGAAINEHVEQYLRKDITDQFAELLKRAQPKGDPGEKLKGKIGAEGHRFFVHVHDAIAMSADEARAEMDKLETVMLDPDAKPHAQDEALERWSVMQVFGGFGSMNAAEMDGALRAAQDVYDNGRKQWLAMLAARKAERDAYREQAFKELGGKADWTDTQLTDADEKERGQREKVRDWFNRHFSFQQVLADIFGNGKTLKRYEQRTRQQTAAKTDAMRQRITEFRDSMLRIFRATSWREAQMKLAALQEKVKNPPVTFFSETQLNRVEVPTDVLRWVLDGTRSKNDFDVTKNLSANDLAELERALALNDAAPANEKKGTISFEHVIDGTPLAKGALSQLEGIHFTMLWRQEQYRKAMTKNGVTVDTIADIEKWLTPEAKEIRAWLADQYDDGYQSLNEVFKRMFGVDLPRVSNYAPGYFEVSNKTTELDPFGSGVDGAGFAAGFLKRRKDHLARPIQIDALQAYWQHVMQTEHWKVFAELTSEMRSVLGDKEVNRTIAARSGAGMAADVNWWIDTIEKGGVRDAQGNSFIAKIMRAMTRVALAYKAGVLLKQLPASIQSLADIPADAWLRSAARVTAGQGAMSVAEAYKLPVIQRRIESGYSPEMRAGMRGPLAKPGVADDIMEWGMTRIGYVDAAFTSYGAAVVFDHHFTEAKAAGMKDPEARALAMTMTEQTIGRTAQPGELMDRSRIELEAQGIGKLLFMFQSANRQAWSIVYAAAKGAITGKKSRAELGRVAFTYFVLVPVITQTMTGLTRYLLTDDDLEESFDWKDYAVAMALGPSSGIMFLGAVMQAAGEMFAGTRFARDANPLIKSLADVAKAGKHFFDDTADNFTAKDFGDAATGVGLLLSGFVNAPTEAAGVTWNVLKQILGVGKNLAEGKEDE